MTKQELSDKLELLNYKLINKSKKATSQKELDEINKKRRAIYSIDWSMLSDDAVVDVLAQEIKHIFA